jgi:hypothetical protein
MAAQPPPEELEEQELKQALQLLRRRRKPHAAAQLEHPGTSVPSPGPADYQYMEVRNPSCKPSCGLVKGGLKDGAGGGRRGTEDTKRHPDS